MLNLKKAVNDTASIFEIYNPAGILGKKAGAPCLISASKTQRLKRLNYRIARGEQKKPHRPQKRITYVESI
jgi:hypothetical protein